MPAATSLPSSSSAPSSSIISVSPTAISDPSDSIVLVNTHSMLTRLKLGIHKPKVRKVVTNYTYQEPPSFAMAFRHPKGVAAMDLEFHSLLKQQTWSLVPPPANKNIVTCKLVFKLKWNNDGTMARYKAKLVARGHLQQYGLDYEETFSPLVKFTIVRLLLALVVNYGWVLKQLDVGNAFLHGILKEEVYMAQPQGYVDQSYPDHVCLLHKAFHGLKQVPQAWFESFSIQLLHVDFVASGVDGNLFIYNHDDHIIFLLLHLDDIIVTGNHPNFIASLVATLGQDFDLKDLGGLHYFLGLQIDYTPARLFVHQTKYTLDLLHKFSMFDCKPCKTPCTPNVHPLPMTVLYCLIPLSIGVCWGLYNILLSLDLLYPLLCNELASSVHEFPYF